MEHTKHLWRAGLLVVAFALAALLGRHFMFPETFGAEGFYRAASRLEFMNLPLVHGEQGSCAECHEDQQETHDEGKHATVPCQDCHAPLADHVRDGKKIEGDENKMPANPSLRLCNLCHLRLAARPKDFPQVVPLEHLLAQEVIEPGDPVPDRSCVLCHPPHKPDTEV
jgi:hypothetical protein